MDFKSFRSKMIEAYGRNRGYAHGFASPHAPSLGGPRHREDDEGWDREPKQADVPHAVHINGKKWKSYGSQSHAQNVAKKIAGATVHKEEVELEEAAKGHTIEAQGIRGMKATPWRKTFKSHEHLAKWADANDSVEVHGTRDLEHAKQKPKKTVQEAKDAREYDYEGDMAKSQLRSIIANAQRAHDMLEDDTNMAEWVQSKITLAADYISTVADYMQAEVNEATSAAQQAAIAINMKKKGMKPKNEEVVLESHEKAAKEIHGALFHNAIPPGSESHFVNSVLKSHGLTPADKGKVVDQVHKMGYTGNKLKEEIVHTRTGADGTKYHIKQDSPNDFSVHREDNGKLKHIDTYGSLHRAKQVLDNEVKEAVDKEHPIAKEYQAMKQHDIKTLRNMIKGQQRIVDTSEYRTKDHAISAYLRHKHGDKRVAAAMGLKEEEMTTRIWEAWGMGRRDPQRGIKVVHQVRSYDFPGMHDDHYIEGHVVGETPHSYHIRTNRVVRAGKEVPIPAHMGHVEAPKGRGMFSDAYAVHKIVAKQDSVAAQPEPAKGGARTFANVRGKR